MAAGQSNQEIARALVVSVGTVKKHLSNIFGKLDATTRELCKAFVAGLNYYLAKNPHVQPRLIKTFEPWHVLAFQRQVGLELCFRYTHLSSSYLPRNNRTIWAAAGSNAWAIAGSRTASGGPMLMVNPHLPFYGFAQLYEAQLAGTDGPDGKPWAFTGATFLGSPVLTIGHNDVLGWTMTTNEPDIADVWEVRFEDPDHPLEYAYGGGTRTAHEWRETILILAGGTPRAEEYVFRSTHHGPIVERKDSQPDKEITDVCGDFDKKFLADAPTPEGFSRYLQRFVKR